MFSKACKSSTYSTIDKIISRITVYSTVCVMHAMCFMSGFKVIHPSRPPFKSRVHVRYPCTLGMNAHLKAWLLSFSIHC